MKEGKSWAEHAKTLAMGGAAGMLSRTCVSPLERIKILHQVQHVAGHQGGERKYMGLGASLRTMFREEGFRGLFKGNGANCVRVFPYVGTQFLCFDLFARVLFDKPRHRSDNPKRLTTVEKLVTGGLAGICSVLVTYPLDFARGRLTSQGGLYETRYRGILHCLTRTVAEEGPRAVYRGIAPTLIGIGPYIGINFAAYETLKEYVPAEKMAANPAMWSTVCGGIAGTTGQSVSYPCDLLRRRFQMRGEYYKDGGILQMMQVIYKEEGFVGFYRGYTANFVKVTPAIAIMFVANDFLKSRFP